VTYRFNREARPRIRLSWQEGYGVVSVREGEVEKLCRYIDDQDRLHQARKLSRILEILEGG
jgi:hypothetical protein